MNKHPNEIDVIVGRNLRAFRQAKGLSIEKTCILLAESKGDKITYQHTYASFDSRL